MAVNEIAALEKNLWGQWSQFGAPAGCSYLWDDEICQLDTPVPSFPYNGVFKFRVAADAEARIDAINRHFEARAVRYFWLVHPTTQPANLDRLLEARGFTESEIFNGMVVEPNRLDAPFSAPGDVLIREIKPADEPIVLEMVAKRWSAPTDAMQHLQAFFRSARIGEPASPMRGWLATINDAPVGKAFTYRTGNIVGLYGVATQPEARGKGVGAAICARALKDSCDDGIDLLALHSTPMAHGLYRRFGFRDVAPFRLFTPAHGTD